MASMPKLKPVGAMGIRAPKEGQGAGIPHMPSGAMDKPHPPLQLNKGNITGFARGGMMQPQRRPMRPTASPADLIRQRAQQAQAAGGQPQQQPAPMPIPMRNGGMAPGYAMGGMVPPPMPMGKPAMPRPSRKPTPMLPGPGGSKSAPMGLARGGMVDTGKMAVPPGEKANAKVKRSKKKPAKKTSAKKKGKR